MDSSHSTTLQPSADPNTGLVEDLDRTGPLSVTTRKDNDGPYWPVFLLQFLLALAQIQSLVAEWCPQCFVTKFSPQYKSCLHFYIFLVGFFKCDFSFILGVFQIQ